ncbi:MAG: GNAT family N-acetyltransferase [Sphingobium sp.]|nr:GNAT family N-acetyltransferase [Sphingobium sp.]
MALHAHMEPISDRDALARRWRAVEEQADTPSFFLRWIWVGSWLSALQAASLPMPDILSMRDEGGTDIALALIGHGSVRRKLGHVPALWLNECGDAQGDRPYMEYNGLLVKAGAEDAAARAFGGAMGRRRDWRALYISGLEEKAVPSPLLAVPGIRRRKMLDRSPAYYVDLNAVRRADGDHLSLLSANSRSQIKRSLKAEGVGLVVMPVRGEADIIAALAEMALLNIGRHHDEAWEDTFFRDFARRLVLAGADDGSVEILCVTAGGEVLGYLLNFLWAGRVMNYQSAFAPPRGPHSKPGLMAHVAAIEHYARRVSDNGKPWGRYSFLAGKDRYKQSLSTNADMLCWWVLERRDIRLEAEALLRLLLRR